MKKLSLLLLFIIITVPLYANISMCEFVVIDNCDNKRIRLGEKLSTVFDLYPNIIFKGEKRYSNITFKEYQGNGIIFSISEFAKSEKEANILMIEIYLNTYSTKKGITIGSNKEEVISKYGDAEYIRNNAYYYYNEEYDVMELIFSFNEEGLVSSIRLAAGT